MSKHECVKKSTRPQIIVFPDGYRVRRLIDNNVWCLEKVIENGDGNIKIDILYSSNKLQSVISQLVDKDIHYYVYPFSYTWRDYDIRCWIESVCKSNPESDFLWFSSCELDNYGVWEFKCFSEAFPHDVEDGDNLDEYIFKLYIEDGKIGDRYTYDIINKYGGLIIDAHNHRVDPVLFNDYKVASVSRRFYLNTSDKDMSYIRIRDKGGFCVNIGYIEHSRDDISSELNYIFECIGLRCLD